MTLTRTPCELDKMSLFQDLKLKRRKVDSRCSSDGESVADTSTSSPDLVSPSSPSIKMEVVPVKMEVGLSPPSPDSTPPSRAQVPEETLSGRLEDSGVFDGGGTTSVIRPLPVIRSQSPPVRPTPIESPTQPPRPHSSPGQPANASPVIRHSPLAMPTPVVITSEQQVTSPISSPVIQRPKTSPQRITAGVITTQHAAALQNQLWLQNSRINGVKPELIGGNFGNATLFAHTSDVKTPLAAGHRMGSAAPIRQAPTVIMGEAGGVRTMIWSQPTLTPTQGTSIDPQLHATTSNWSSGSSNSAGTSNPEESAAQMLLNLGQDRVRIEVTRPPVTARSPTTTTASTTFPSHFTNVPLNMERLWAGDLTQLPSNQQIQALNLTSPLPNPLMYSSPRPDIKLPGMSESSVSGGAQDTTEEEEQPMICMICEDKATGLHYGIITCEGCKGFFKRTVQNRRVYTCVADGNCEITKAQRNRCQYCRFKKCIEQGMVLQAVREDRMPGGRNSGAVYNLYKVKYKKHKKAASKQAQQKPAEKILSPQIKSEVPASIPPHLVNGTILKTALTNPSEVVHLRQRLDSAVSSSRDRNFSIEYTLSMIQTLIDCDEFQDIATLQNLDDLLDHNTDLSEKLCHIELPVEVHTRLLTHKWHELLVLTTSAYQAIHKSGSEQLTTVIEPEFSIEVETNLCTLQNCLTSMMGREITMDQLRQDVGLMIEKITHVTLMFRRVKLTMEEYVCLKVITMLNQARPGSSTGNSELENIRERYMTCLRVYTQHMCPQQPTRFQELLHRLPEVQSAAALLLESKMFYVPFLLNSAIQR